MKVIAVLLLALATASAGTLPSLRPIHPRDRTVEQSIEGRIIGGHDAYQGQVPHQVGIVFSGGGTNWFCGGSSISNIWVMTAAHCTKGGKSATIYAGSIVIQSGEIQTVNSANFRQHSDFNENTLVNDISLIKLTKPLVLGSWINTIGLPPLTGPYDTYENQNATISGWGLTSNSAIAQPLILQVAKDKVISNSDCNTVYPGLIKAGQLCTIGTNGQSTCFGDSGGPLTIGSIQIAIVSFVSSAGCNQAPNGHTRVTAYRNWIYTTSGV